MLISQKKRLQVLSSQFQKLNVLNSLQLTNSHFWLGFLTAYIRSPEKSQQWTGLMKMLNNTVNLSHEELFSQKNIIELILAACDNEVCKSTRDKWIKEPGAQIKNINQFIDKNIGELTIDNKFLTKKYYSNEPSSEVLQSNLDKKNSDLGLICSICCQNITHTTVCPISCGHLLHKTCLQEYSKEKVKNKLLPILCPEQACDKQIPTHDLEEYLDKETLKKFYQFSLQQFVDKNKETSWCPTAGCEAIFQFDQQLIEYKCPLCKKNYCLKCKGQFHKNMTCEENMALQNLSQEDKQFMEFVKGSKYKQCPQCKFWVSKNRGCDHMTCRCTYQFCYRCGSKYGECDCQQNQSFYDSHGSNDSENQEQNDNLSDL